MSIREEIKVLIVDDEPSILLSLEFLMKKEGYKVFIARDGQEAFDILAEHKPQIILLDIMMPRVDGYEVCRHIRQSPDHQNMKVIFMSARNKETDIELGYEVGADLYIPKPFSTRDLVKKVNMLTTGLIL
jgi:DNA-binding response OmpR family regulator